LEHDAKMIIYADGSKIRNAFMNENCEKCLIFSYILKYKRVAVISWVNAVCLQLSASD